MKKILFLIAGFIISLAIIPNVFALELKDVSDITGNDTLISGKGDVTKINDKTTKITYKDAEFNYVSAAKNEAGNRPEENAWIGIKVAYPDTVTKDSYNVYINGKLHDEGLREDSSYSEWFGINLDRLNEAIENNTKITYRVAFDWDKTGDKEDQVVIIEIDPMTISLYESKEKSVEVWTPAMALEKKAELDNVKKQEENKEAPKTSTDNTKNPNTADSIYLWLGILAISGIGLGCLVKKLN